MSVLDDEQPEQQSDREFLEERLGEYRHVLEAIVEDDGPLSEDAQAALDILDNGGDQS